MSNKLPLLTMKSDVNWIGWLHLDASQSLGLLEKNTDFLMPIN